MWVTLVYKRKISNTCLAIVWYFMSIYSDSRLFKSQRLQENPISEQESLSAMSAETTHWKTLGFAIVSSIHRCWRGYRLLECIFTSETLVFLFNIFWLLIYSSALMNNEHVIAYMNFLISSVYRYECVIAFSYLSGDGCISRVGGDWQFNSAKGRIRKRRIPNARMQC